MIPPIALDRLQELTTRAIEQNGEQHAELRMIEQSLVLRGEHVGYLPQHFKLEEFMPPEILAQYGDRSWEFMDDRILWTADAIWEHFRPTATLSEGQKYYVLCNTWSWGGSSKYRGFRPPEIDSRREWHEGAYCSQHKHGRALDLTVAGQTPREVYDEILGNQRNKHFRYITRIKLYDWGVHVDCANTREYRLVEL